MCPITLYEMNEALSEKNGGVPRFRKRRLRNSLEIQTWVDIVTCIQLLTAEIKIEWFLNFDVIGEVKNIFSFKVLFPIPENQRSNSAKVFPFLYLFKDFSFTKK